MAHDRLRRLAETMKPTGEESRPEDASELGLLEKRAWIGREKWKQLIIAMQEAIEKFQKNVEDVHGPTEAAKWKDLAVAHPDYDAMTIQKHESPFIDCTLRLVDANTSIQGAIKGAKKRPTSTSLPGTPIRIDLKADVHGEAYFSFKGRKFYKAKTVAEEALSTIITTAKEETQ